MNLPGNYGIRPAHGFFDNTNIGRAIRTGTFLGSQALYHAPVLASAAYSSYQSSKRKRHDTYDRQHNIKHHKNITKTGQKRKRTYNQTNYSQKKSKQGISTMPYGRSYKKRYRKKPRGRRRRRRRGRAQIPPGQFAVKLQHNADLTSDAGGLLNWRHNMVNPDRALNGAGSASSFSDYKALFNTYKVVGIKIDYIPYLYQDPSGTTIFRPLGHTVRTITNDAGNITTFDDIIDEDNYKVYDLRRKFSIYRKVWTPQSMEVTATNSVAVSAGGWMATGDLPILHTPSMLFASEGLTASKIYGKIIVHYYIRFKDRKT